MWTKDGTLENSRKRGQHNINIIKRDIRIYVSYIAGQTAGLNGLKFFLDTHGLPEGEAKKKEKHSKLFFKINFLLIQRATAGPSANSL